MIEIILATITAILTIFSTFVGAKMITKSECNSNCCDVVLQED